jgi:hypothetical protein
MSNLFHFASTRSPLKLTEENRDTVGLHLFNDGATSQHMTDLLPFLEHNDHPGIYNSMVGFLSSTGAIVSDTQLSALLGGFVHLMRKRGRKLNASNVTDTLTMAKLTPYFAATGGVQTPYLTDKQAIEDTIMALAFIGKLGNRKNTDLQRMYRASRIAKAVYDDGGTISEGTLRELLTKPLVIPAHRYNPCAVRHDTIRPYQHLDLSPVQKPAGEGGTTVANGVGKAPLTADDCNCGCNTPECQQQNTCCAELRPFVADLMLVREDLECYEAHDLAYIETIMAGETRKREHRTLEQLETYTERETETTKSLERDHQVEDRFSLKSQISKTIEQDMSLEAGVKVTADFGEVAVETDLGFATSDSRSESYEQAKEYALNVIRRAVSKVEEKVRELNTTRRLSEVEEKNTHEFTNPGTKHINGQYHFVNRINKAQVMNYGKRLMFEFVLPEPMELYKKLLEKNVRPFGIEEPQKPMIRIDQIQPGARKEDNTPTDSYTDVNGTITYSPAGVYNYLDLMHYYNLSDIETMPDPDIRLPFGFQNTTRVNGDNEVLAFKELIGQVPAGYNARMLTVTIKGYDTEGSVAPDNGVVLQLQWFANDVSSGLIPYVAGDLMAEDTRTVNIDAAQDSQLSLVIMAKSTVGVAGSGTVTCLLSDQAKTAWRTMVWEKIMEKYAQDLQEYKSALARYEQDKAARLPFGNNPFINREIERTELKRLAISFISCQFYDQFNAMKRNVAPCGYPEMSLPEAKSEGDFIRFFEQLFQWNLMTYLFYPYFWGQKCSWPEKVQTSSGDPLFDKALMAGAAKVQIPVRPGMELLAMHWVNYHEIWEGESEPPVAGEDYYLSMAQEIKEQKNCFYRDREGDLKATVGEDTITLTGTDYYWDNLTNTLNIVNIEADLNREIILNTCEVYRIVDIFEGELPGPVTSPVHDIWTIVLERSFEGKGCCGCDKPEAGTVFTHLPYQTGAVFVGAPFEVLVPTNLVYLRNRKDETTGEYLTAACLPCYPLENNCDQP